MDQEMDMRNITAVNLNEEKKKEEEAELAETETLKLTNSNKSDGFLDRNTQN